MTSIAKQRRPREPNIKIPGRPKEPNLAKALGWSQEEINLALERGLSEMKASGLNGGFSWAWLIPLLGELAKPIAAALMKKLGEWASSKINPNGRYQIAGPHNTIAGPAGGSFTPTSGGSFYPTRGRGGYIAIRPGVTTPQLGIQQDNHFIRYSRGANTPQPTLLSNSAYQGRDIDRINYTYMKGKGQTGGALDLNEGLKLIQKELQPYINDPTAFKRKLTELVNMGHNWLKNQQKKK